MLKPSKKPLLLAIFIIAALWVLPSRSHAAPGDIVRVSVASDGTEGNDYSDDATISADGRYIAFSSRASNLVSGDTNDRDDIFVRDTQTNTTSRASLSSTSAEADSDSQNPAISGDGRFVTFESSATNLVGSDTNNARDVFLHDRQTGQTTRVSISSGGSEGDGESRFPAISADGRYIAFRSAATTLVPNDTNNEYDIFVHDTQTGQTTRVSIASDGTEANDYSTDLDISADGRFVTFDSVATNLVSNDTNSRRDVFVHDTQTGQTSRVSVASDSTEGNWNSEYPAISADGRFVTFSSEATTLVADDENGTTEDIFLHDTQTSTTTLISRADDGSKGNSDSRYPNISDDGRFISYQSSANSLTPEETHDEENVFLYDQHLNTTKLISVTLLGNGTDYEAILPVVSGNGQFIAFGSSEPNFVSGDNNDELDVFVYENNVLNFSNHVYIPFIIK
ncbi:hypothetical protein [Candidatus Leptofilum sp.]|uniref:TolB family protein n=1 Tax=Candidatus Leptofilum sp. TaxID=3241576 RepID=UPI003B5AA0C8